MTEDQELASGHKSHRGGPHDSSFWDQLEAAGIKAHKIIHIEFILVKDGGAFANNTAWLSALLARECNCQGFIFWKVGTSYLLSGGAASELYKITKKVEACIAVMEVHIRGKLLNLKYRFVPVQLVYKKVALKKDLREMNTLKDDNYNRLILDDVKTTYPDTHAELSDPNEVLAVKTCTDTVTVYGQVHKTVRYSVRDGNDRHDSRNMNDLDQQNYMVSLVKWVKKNYKAETQSEMKKANVPKPKANTRGPENFLT